MTSHNYIVAVAIAWLMGMAWGNNQPTVAKNGTASKHLCHRKWTQHVSAGVSKHVKIPIYIYLSGLHNTIYDGFRTKYAIWTLPSCFRPMFRFFEPRTHAYYQWRFIIRKKKRHALLYTPVTEEIMNIKMISVKAMVLTTRRTFCFCDRVWWITNDDCGGKACNVSNSRRYMLCF